MYSHILQNRTVHSEAFIFHGKINLIPFCVHTLFYDATCNLLMKLVDSFETWYASNFTTCILC